MAGTVGQWHALCLVANAGTADPWRALKRVAIYDGPTPQANSDARLLNPAFIDIDGDGDTGPPKNKNYSNAPIGFAISLSLVSSLN